MGLFKNKDQVITAPVDPTKLITKSPVEEWQGGNVKFDIPEDYIGVFFYDRMNYVFYREDILIPQTKEEAFFPKKAFISGNKFKFYLVNPNYKFDTIKTAILNQHYEKEKAKGVEFKCTFRVDLYIKLLKGNKSILKEVVKNHADRIEHNRSIPSNKRFENTTVMGTRKRHRISATPFFVPLRILTKPWRVSCW